ncbi:hypothetical protein M5M_16495 [Simiduia agarivorans SA1 = DSM 21679]|uniref:DUF6795 domain-containing protein n=1 Tax=Simiduia agarivorans (strain DSM 21679 / JCM 13881 / BCRC 17597 / SA1) TaxID=1117647 RepID=K4KMM6_SIMAS|nr:hypothetical protein M5M_16495 [Simiduia agarivorans SA1 = DSM 21679]
MAKANLFSSVKGVLTLSGSPLAGATINRSVRWRDEEHTDSTTTDKDGRFEFPAIMSSGSIPRLPAEFNAFQSMTVDHDGSQVLIWETVKAESEENAELEGQPMVLTCELSEASRFEHLLLNSIETRCRW